MYKQTNVFECKEGQTFTNTASDYILQVTFSDNYHMNWGVKSKEKKSIFPEKSFKNHFSVFQLYIYQRSELINMI